METLQNFIFFFQVFVKIKKTKKNKHKDMVQLEFSTKHSVVREWLEDI